MNKKAFILLCALLGCVLCACNKDSVEKKWLEEEAKLAEWIKENRPDALFKNNIYFEKEGIEYPDNMSPEPENKDHVLVNFTCRFLYDNIIETVSYKDWQSHGAQFISSYREGGPELWPYERWESMGIAQLHENELANIYIPSRMLNLQDFKTRKFEIELVKVIDTDLKSYQEKIMGHCMKKFNKDVDTITITENGRDFYVIYHVDEGKGDPVEVSSVKTQYTEVYYLQEDDPRTCVTNRAKTGWNNKFSKMFQKVKKGGKITAVMPYRLMYGEEPYKDNNTQQFIAPLGSVLKYEISIDQ